MPCNTRSTTSQKVILKIPPKASNTAGTEAAAAETSINGEQATKKSGTAVFSWNGP